MRIYKSPRGFFLIIHTEYCGPHEETRLIGESSAIGDYDNSMDCPGSSYLWIGAHHHLNREEVAELIGRMQSWLDCGRLQKEGEG